MLTAMLLAHLLNHPATATATWDVQVAIETAIVARTERHEKAERLGRWLDSLDGIRIRSMATYSPFADEEQYPNPFEGE